MRLPVFSNGLAPLFAFCLPGGIIIRRVCRVYFTGYHHHVVEAHLPFNMNTNPKTNFFLTKN